MIKINDLTFTYPGAQSPNLKHITLHIEKGDFLAVIGNNGCGKSTLCKTLNGLIPHFINGDFEGSVEIDGLNTLDHEVGHLAQKVGYVYQDFENQIVRPTVLDDASFACLNYAMPDYEEKGKTALQMCGLSHKAKDYIWQLSGGQKHLLALAGMVALSPEVLILDEPIAQLDPFHAREIYEVLKDLNEKYGKTIIVIEHHTEFIADYCKHALLMKDGEIVWKLPAKEALRQVEVLESSNIFPPQVTVAARKLQLAGLLPEDTLLPTTIEEGKETLKNLTFAKAPISFSPYKCESTPLIEFNQVTATYLAVKGHPTKVLNEFSLNIKKGEKIALIGSNGAGKSTLMKLIMGLIKPASGEVLLNGISTKNVAPEKLSQMVSLVYQNPEEMFIKDSIRSDIEYAMQVRNVPEYKKRANELLSLFNLTALAERDGRLLSGGQMRRASLAIGIALSPSILLLDEPTANLDIATRKEIIATLNRLKDITETVMIATHDMQLVCEWADRIIVLSGGYLIADGNRYEVFHDHYVTHTVGIRPPDIYAVAQSLEPTAQCYTIDEFITAFGKEKQNVC